MTFTTKLLSHLSLATHAAAIALWLAAGSSSAGTVELTVTERQGVARHDEPITCGVPLPKGELHDIGHVRLVRDGQEVPAQFRAAGLWRPDRSIRWLLVDLRTDIEAGARQTYTLHYGPGVSSTVKQAAAIRVAEDDERCIVDTGAALFCVSKRLFSLFEEVRLTDGTVLVPRPAPGQVRHGAVVRGLRPMVTRAIPAAGNKGRSHLIFASCSAEAGPEDYTLRFVSDRQYELRGAGCGMVGRGAYLVDFTSSDSLISIPGGAWLPYAYPAKGDVYTFRTTGANSSAPSEGVFQATVLERGPMRTVLRLKGSFGPPGAPALEYTAWYHFYAGSGRVKLEFTLENNNHGGRTPDGNARNADIGGVNCVFFDEMALRVPLELARPESVRLGGEPGAEPIAAEAGTRAELYQDSSGAPHWNRYQDPKCHPRPNSYVSFPGYRAWVEGKEAAAGKRALGWMELADAAREVTVAVEDFWQNYPKSLVAGKDGVVEIGLFPGRYAADFPLRSGEHKTHTVLFDFHRLSAGDQRSERLARGFSDPLRLEPSPAWFARTRALGRLHPFDPAHYRAYEVRNLSTIGEFPEGVTPGPSLVSRLEEHEFFGWMDYGDVPIDFEAPSGQWGMKYDLDHAMTVQYARTLNPKWWRLLAAADKHTRDIDVHHQPHHPTLHFVKGGVWAHSTHDEPGHKNPHRNYNHFTKDLCFGARGTALWHYLTGDWKSHDACLEIAENALAQYMSPQQHPGPPEKNNRMGIRGDAGTLERLLEGYLLSGDEKFLQRARWQIAACAFDGRPPKHEAISLWSSLFYMMALARYLELFPEDGPARSWFLAHAETLRQGTDPVHGIYYTITPQPDGRVIGKGTCSHYNIMAADALAFAHLLTGDPKYLDTAQRCFAYGVKNACWAGGPPTYVQVHSANGAMYGNLFMTVDSPSRQP